MYKRQVLGANDCLQLHQLNTLAREKILRHFMAEGVDIPCADGVIIGPDVHLENNITILPGTILRGQTTVRSGCMLGPNTLLTDCSVGEGAVLNTVPVSYTHLDVYKRQSLQTSFQILVLDFSSSCE